MGVFILGCEGCQKVAFQKSLNQKNDLFSILLQILPLRMRLSLALGNLLEIQVFDFLFLLNHIRWLAIRV